MKNPIATNPLAMPAVTDEAVVPWPELAQVCGAPGYLAGDGTILPEAVEWARANGVTIRGHWRHGAGLSPLDAARVRVAYERARAEDAAIQAAFQQDAAERKLRRARDNREAEAKREQEAAEARSERARQRQAKRDAEAALTAQNEAVPDPDFDSFKAQYQATGRAS